MLPLLSSAQCLSMSLPLLLCTFCVPFLILALLTTPSSFAKTLAETSTSDTTSLTELTVPLPRKPHIHENLLVSSVTLAAAAPLDAESPTSSNGSSAASSTYLWIVQGNSTGKLAPNCSDLCVTVLNDDPNFSVMLQPCQGLSSSELWMYDPQSMSIKSKVGSSSGVQLCLDAADAERLQLTSCIGSTAQTWLYHNQTMSFQGGALNSTSMYLTGQIRTSSAWGSGINNYTLQLAAESSAQSNGYGTIFTMLPFYNPLLIEFTVTTSFSAGGNLVQNSGFEKANYDPGKGFATIDDTQPLYLCSWYVVSNEVEYSGTNLWQPEDGTHSLHLNSAKIAKPGSVVQMLATIIGFNYTLGFYMAGNPDLNCGDTNKTMKVEVTSSSLPEQDLWFDASKAGAGEMGYKHVYPLGFTALAEHVNLTFTSLTTGSCGPVIDNITVLNVDGPLPPLYSEGASLTGSRSSMAVYAKVLLGLAGAALALIFACMVLVWIKKKKAAVLSRNISSINNGSSGTHARWWESFKLEEHLVSFDKMGSGIKELTWKQIERATKNFTTIVGEGGFSTVYRAELGNGQVGAVKMEKTRDRSRQIFKQELSVLARLRHPNLVNLLGFCNEREEGILVFEYMAHGSLHQRLHPPAHQMYMPLTWKKRMDIVRQVASALCYLHEDARPAVVHGDVKSANVLLDELDNAKLCDFGFSSRAGPNSSVFHSTVASVKGSLGYLDPQYLKNGRLSSKSDVYSFGVLLIELVTGLPAFDMHRAEALTSFAAPYVQDMDMMEMVVDARLAGSFEMTELTVICRVARLCLQEDGMSRPTMAEVICQLASSTVNHLPSAQPQDLDSNELSLFSDD